MMMMMIIERAGILFRLPGFALYWKTWEELSGSQSDEMSCIQEEVGSYRMLIQHRIYRVLYYSCPLLKVILVTRGLSCLKGFAIILWKQKPSTIGTGRLTEVYQQGNIFSLITWAGLAQKWFSSQSFSRGDAFLERDLFSPLGARGLWLTGRFGDAQPKMRTAQKWSFRGGATQ